MTVVRVAPSTAHGTVRAPPSKSYTHRLLLVAHLSGRHGRLRHPLASDDTLRTVAAVRHLGSRVHFGRDHWTIEPGAAPAASRTTVIDCGESGTTLRLVTAVASLLRARFRFVGSGRLPLRPMEPLFDALASLGATIARPRASTTLPFDLRGPIHGGPVALEVAMSSQFTSALLLTLPTVRPDSRLTTVGTAVSEPYVRATRAVLRRFGVRVTARRGGYGIPGGQTYRPVDAAVPGDASSAAYLWAAAAVTAGRASVRGISFDWPQADLAVLELLDRYGAIVRRSTSAVVVEGDRRRPFRVSLSDAPDLYPLAGVLAAAAPGRSYLRGAAHVAAKESDRKRETARLVRAMGGRAEETDDGLAIDGVARPRPFRLRGIADHRLVMSAAVAAAAADGPSEISDARAVGKSYPGFFDALAELGVEATSR